MRRFSIHLLFALNGLALALAYPPFDLWPLAWFALVPPMYLATSATPKHLIACGFVLGFVWAAVMLGWLWVLFSAFAILLWILIGVLVAMALGLIALVRRAWGESAALWLATPIWLGVDFFRSEIWPLKFSWMSLGYSQHRFEGFIQLASVVGVYGLTFTVVLFNMLIVRALRKGKLSWVAIPLFAGILVVGSLSTLEAPTSPSTLQVAGAQLEFPSKEHLVETAKRLAAKKPDILVFPEYCAVGMIDELHRLAASKHLTIVYGAKVPAPQNDFYSAAVIAHPDGTVRIQEKSVPVPLLPDGLPARERRPERGLGVAICYDMDFTFVTNELVSKGAQILIYPTMDNGSWGDTQHLQHAMVTRFRSIEHRRWVVRCASAGITQIVDPAGRVFVQGEEFSRSVGLMQVTTMYDTCGWTLPWACLGLTGLSLAAAVMRRRRRAVALESMARTVP